ncbi:hypothetical protein PybrP1_010112 [[Pythium] brassicae (nom. inval.)]|nr:hypothetical protein PybrP1_010112 [[Pythium] brassicae (nom. inval.)]
MDGGDSRNPNSYENEGARRRKRSFDDGSERRADPYDPRRDEHKRARYDERGGGGSGNFRPRDDRYGGGGGGFRSRGGRFDRFSSGGGANGESDRARAWRLTKKALVELGETTQLGDDVAAGAALREHMQAAAGRVLAELEASDEDAKLGHLAALVLRCASKLAHKTALYAVLAGLVNEKKPAFGRKLLDEALALLQRDLDFFSIERAAELQEKGDDDALRTSRDVATVALRVQLLVRFLGELASTRVLKGDDLLAALDALQSVCTPDDFNAESDEPLRAREHAAAFKDFFASVVLDTLLHCGRSLAVGHDDMYESLLSRCKEYVSAREEESNPRGTETDHPTSWLVRRLRLDLVWEPETEEEQSAFCKKVDPLALQWEALNLVLAATPTAAGDGSDSGSSSSSSDRWPIPGVVYPQADFASHFGGVEPHGIATPLTVDASTFDTTKIPPYHALFRVLTEDAGAAGSAVANLPLASYVVVRGHLLSALQAFQPKPAMAAKQLLSMCKNLNARFAAAGLAVKSEFLLLETLFVAALTESSVATVAYYCAVLCQLVKSEARVVSAALAVVVELLFREAAFMSAGAVDAFVKVFSHLLSNFEFKWPWANWAHVLEAQEDDAQRLVVSAVIERCVRLSYLQHMQSVLPSEFHMLLPPAPKPRIRFQIADLDETNDASGVTPATRDLYQAVTAKLKAHPPAAAFESWLADETAAAGVARSDVVEVVWTCLLEAGAATFTHMRMLLDKYGHAEPLFGGDASELVLVKTVGFVWLKSPQHIGLILNMMLQQQIIRATTIATWIFTPDAVQQYSWPYVWGILDETVEYVQAAIADARRQLAGRAAAAAGKDAADEAEMVDVPAAEAALAAREAELAQILTLLFEGFNRVVTEHKSNCDADGVAYKDNWFVSALAQMKAVGSKFRHAMELVADDLQGRVFGSNSADHDVKKVFQFLLDSYRRP